ncbi:unnamed protein product, partial [Chrysoparadoxa australica]
LQARYHFKGRCGDCGEYGHKKSDCTRNAVPSNMKQRGYQRGGRSQKPFPWNCNYCGIKGHKEADCRKKKRAQSNAQDGINPTLALMTRRGQDHNKITNVDQWVGDSG